MASKKQTKASVILKENQIQIAPQILKSMQIINHYGGTHFIKQQKAQAALFQFFKVKQWTAIKLYINNLLCRDNVILHIKDISFPNLTVLDLKKNNIESVQGLSYLSAPKLTAIHLSSNKISNISSLRKTSSPNLKRLYFDDNMINQIDCLSEMRWGDLQCISVEFSFSPNQSQSIAVFNKFEALNTVKSFIMNIGSPDRLKNTKSLQKLKQHFKNGEQGCTIRVKQ